MQPDGDDLALTTDDSTEVKDSARELHAGTSHLCTQFDGVDGSPYQLHKPYRQQKWHCSNYMYMCSYSVSRHDPLHF